MEQKSNTFLETQPIGRLMVKYAVPCVISLLVAALYNIVDQIFIANADYLGAYGNAANTVVFPLTVVALAIAVMIGDGCCAFVSISLGAGRKEDAHKSVGSAVLLCVTVSVALMAVYLIFRDAILTMFGGRVNEETFVQAQEYFFWIALGIPFYMFGQALNPIIRSDGSPQFAMASTLAGAVVNIILDPVFIFVFRWGMMGAAVATVLGQILTAVLAIWYGPDIPLSAFVVIIKLFQIILSIACGITAGALPIMGYNYGARLYSRVKETFRLVVLSTLTVCVVATVLFESVPLVFVRMFGSDGGELYTNFAIGCLRIYLSLVIFTCLQKACAMFLQSIGHAKAAVPLSVLRDVLLIVLAILMPMRMGIMGILWSAPVADLIAMVITAVVVARVWRAMGADAQPVGQTETVLQTTRPGVIVTIAREHGSAGKRVGQLVAEKLGVPCYYKEMTALAAQESGLAREFISGINSDENAVMRDLYLSTNVVQQAIAAQDKAINMIADAGSCVIVGRAADYVLRERDNVVRVFVHAPRDYRVKKVMEMYGDSEAEGKKSIARSDAARGAYYKSISGRDWGDPHQYELSVDSSIGPEKTAELICAYVDRA